VRRPRARDRPSAGAVILGGARIGRGRLVGAGALVTDGEQFPNRSLIVGSPARAARTLDEAAVAALRRWAAHCADSRRRFAAGLVAICWKRGRPLGQGRPQIEAELGGRVRLRNFGCERS
jgi:hypothetical protein